MQIVRIVIALIWLVSTGWAQDTKGQFVIPDWVADAIFYQIFPERFANGDTTNDPPNVQVWGGKPEINNYFGGDLRGIINRLDYLQDLGINALYLNPIFESNTNHKYHTTDYYKIDPHFGDDKVFQELLSRCRERGIRVVIDGVFNHTGVGFFAFEDIKKNETQSKYLSWYKIHSFPVAPPEKPNYEAWWGLGELPKLMADTPAVRDYLFDVTKYWTKMGIDGWRLDVPNEMSHDFWIRWRKLVRDINPNVYIVGEIWDDATPWLKGDQFDAVMNYRFRGACVGYLALHNRDAVQFDSILTATRKSHPDNVNYALQNLIGSHDTERFLTLCQGDVNQLKLAALMQMTYVGAPMVYYGDEIGMTGEKDPDCRKTMVWDKSNWNHDLFNWYRTLIKLRRDYELFRRGSYRTVLVDRESNLFGFVRVGAEGNALVIMNNGKKQVSMSGLLPEFENERWFDLLSDPQQSTELYLKNIIVPASTGIILLAPSYQ